MWENELGGLKSRIAFRPAEQRLYRWMNKRVYLKFERIIKKITVFPSHFRHSTHRAYNVYTNISHKLYTVDLLAGLLKWEWNIFV